MTTFAEVGVVGGGPAGARVAELLAARAEALFALIASGALDVRIGARYPLEQARQAHEDLQARRSTGKLLLIP